MRARIRTVKPEILSDEELWDLGVVTGYPILQAFIGLWQYADREGRFEWRPRMLGPAILPYWKGDFEAVLDALEKSRFIVKYEVENREYGFVRTFHKHQALNNREPPSNLPEPPIIPQTPTRESRVEHASGTRSTNGEGDSSTRSGRVDKLVKGNGNGKGTEWISGMDLGNGKGTEPDQDRGPGADPQSPTPPSEGSDKSKPEPASEPEPNWAALAFDDYCDEFGLRYRDPEGEPIKATSNAKVRGIFAKLVKRVPGHEAPQIARHFVRSNEEYYIRRGHNPECLLADAEKLRTEWLGQTHSTTSEARRLDRMTARKHGYERAFEQLAEEDARERGER